MEGEPRNVPPALRRSSLPQFVHLGIMERNGRRL